MTDYLIIRLSSLGDIIHTIPAFSALRKKFPTDRISWAVEPAGKEILDLVPGIDNIAVINRKRWFRSLRPIKKKAQTALDFQGLLKSAFLAYLTASRSRVGFSRKNLKEPLASLFYTEQIPEFLEQGTHVISKNLRLLAAVGIVTDCYEFPIRLPDRLGELMRVKLRENGHAPGQKLIVCNVGAAWDSKRWPPAKWEAVINALKREYSYVLLLWGNESELRLAREISARTKTAVAPFLSIAEVMALLKEASLLISGDTFALQAACALSVPVVGIFGPTDSRRNGPFSPRDSVACLNLDCGPCYKADCDTMECMKRIEPDEVAALAIRLLERQ